MQRTKKVLITGSSTGLGFELAKGLMESNYEVITHSREEASFLNNGQLAHFSGDLSCETSVMKICEELKRREIKIDYYICNAGSGSSAKMGDETKEDWIESFEKNFYSTVIFLNVVDKYLLSGNERILTIGSICGSRYIQGAPNTYSCAKAALAAFVRNYSIYLSNKNVNIVNLELGNMLFPGSIWERKISDDEKNVKKMISAGVPLNKFGSPSGIIGLIDWYFTSKDQFATGTSFTLDGGQTL